MSKKREDAENEALFAGLKVLDTRAIVRLQERAAPMIRSLVSANGLPRELAEDILNDTTLIFLQKITSGAYRYEGWQLTTYCVEIAKRLVWAALRQRRTATTPIEEIAEVPDVYLIDFERQKESAEIVLLLLDEIGEPCRTLIRLYHIEGYSDEEVVKQRLSLYSTADALKTKRSFCMKKLTQLAQQWKIKKIIP